MYTFHRGLDYIMRVNELTAMIGAYFILSILWSSTVSFARECVLQTVPRRLSAVTL